MSNPPPPSPSTVCPGFSPDDQTLVFNAPWEAKAFAIVNHLATDQHCTWSEWTEYLVNEISTTDQEAPGSVTYYEQWVIACEKMLMAKGLIDAQGINSKLDELAAEREANHHH
ncbi:nitrile hydratase accessory protein [Nodosilinea sp. E11]|uniref:nitrile hydratase accessory protein n=1 Tax=Nodosilinea sp. E11 TaxID=3037479 RepID=UPI002934B930|nr:nitrile hydratase accessory protein [Nodosilinea sp. E11]WOD39615.1 nitrile hydratase accessory protein [Nodosilinea sp. E11]